LTDFTFPVGVHRVVSRGRLYYYFQAGRSTAHEGPRIRLPDDPHLPEFWAALRAAQGFTALDVVPDNFEQLCKEFETYIESKAADLSAGTIRVYKINLQPARKHWATVDPRSLRPMHVANLHDALADTPGKADNMLGVLSSLSRWALLNGKLDVALTHGVERYGSTGGHIPWTPKQQALIPLMEGEHEAQMVRRGLMLAMWTGQRISDFVRMGWSHIDDDDDGQPGFDLGFRGQWKTGVRPWCPMWPELEAEIATWAKRNRDEFLYQRDGEPYNVQLFRNHYNEVRKARPLIAGDEAAGIKPASIHGLRGTCVVRLKRHGFSAETIGDMVGMSPAMVTRYTRFEDKKAGAKAQAAPIIAHQRARAAGKPRLAVVK